MGGVVAGMGGREGPEGKGPNQSFFSEPELERGLELLFRGTNLATHRWHCFRRGGGVQPPGVGGGVGAPHGVWRLGFHQ